MIHLKDESGKHWFRGRPDPVKLEDRTSKCVSPQVIPPASLKIQRGKWKIYFGNKLQGANITSI